MNILLKAKYSFISALAFFIVANPETFKFTQNLGTAVQILDRGVVTPSGLLLHTAIFFGVMMALMLIPA